MDSGTAFLLGLLLGVALLVAAVFWDEAKMVSKDASIVWVTNDGVVCNPSKYYPNLNCKLISKAIGPRLNTLQKDK